MTTLLEGAAVAANAGLRLNGVDSSFPGTPLVNYSMRLAKRCSGAAYGLASSLGRFRSSPITPAGKVLCRLSLRLPPPARTDSRRLARFANGAPVQPRAHQRRCEKWKDPQEFALTCLDARGDISQRSNQPERGLQRLFAGLILELSLQFV